MAMPSGVLELVVMEIPQAAFRKLNNKILFALLDSKADGVRKVTALKCVRTLSKARLGKLLATYSSPGRYRYYNVVHWPDFGVSAPRERATAAADTILRDV